MVKLALLMSFVLDANAHAAPNASTIKFDYRNVDITKVIFDYAAASGQRFVLDEQIKGRVTLVNPRPVTLTEAYDQLSTALAGNGQGIAVNGDVMHVMSARALQRNNVPVVKDLPAAIPERMVTWIYRAKFASVDAINTQLRILTSRDGELVPYPTLNELVISDWTTNLQRIAAILREIDVPSESKTPGVPK